MEFKKRLAREIVSFYHSSEESVKAEEAFKSTVQMGEVPEDIPTLPYTSGATISQIISGTSVTYSGKETYRLIEQGWTAIAGKVIKDPNTIPNIMDGDILKVGKRNFYKLKLN